MNNIIIMEGIVSWSELTYSLKCAQTFSEPLVVARAEGVLYGRVNSLKSSAFTGIVFSKMYSDYKNADLRCEHSEDMSETYVYIGCREKEKERCTERVNKFMEELIRR